MKTTRPNASMSGLVLICRLLLVASIFIGWELAVRGNLISPMLFGQPSGIYQALVDGLLTHSTLWTDLGWTMASTFLAFLIGSGVALVLGMTFVVLPISEKILEPLLAALNAMPRIALAPLLILWFGLGMGSKVAIGASLVFFIVLQSVVAGGRGVNQDHLTLGTTLGLKPLHSFWKITMPTAVPVVFSGLRLGMMYALLGVVAGEIIASEHGLGQRVAYLTASFDVNGVWAVVFLLAAVGMMLSWSLGALESRLLRWR